MKKFLTISAVALFAVILGQNVTHASTDSLTWTFDNATAKSGNYVESAYFYHNNEWVYVDVTNPSETENAPLQYFGGDVKNGNDDGFHYTIDKETKLITGVESYRARASENYTGEYYKELTGHNYLAPGETAHFKLKVAATSGFTSVSATKVRGVYYNFYKQVSYSDGIDWTSKNFKLNVHFWTQDEGWDGTFDTRY